MIQSARARTTAVVFDLDGAFARHHDLGPAAYADTVRVLGGPDVSPADIVAAWHIGSTPVVLAHFLGRSTLAEDVECFYRHFEAAVAAARRHAVAEAPSDIVGHLRRPGPGTCLRSGRWCWMS